MANTTVGIRERVKIEGRWLWSCNLRPPEDKLTPSEAERNGKFYLVWTEGGKKREQRVKGNFETAVKAARAKERHLEDAADGFERPDPLKKKAERITIADAIERRLRSIEVTFEHDTLKSHRQALRQFQKWTKRRFVDEIDHDHLMEFRRADEARQRTQVPEKPRQRQAHRESEDMHPKPSSHSGRIVVNPEVVRFIRSSRCAKTRLLRCSRCPLAPILPLFPRRLQFPIPLGQIPS